MKHTNFFAAIALFCLIGCGNNNGSTSGAKTEEREENERVLVEASPGTYYTVLRPINFHANGFIPYGSATIKLKNDELEVSINLDDDQAVPHRQSLHIGTRCPTLRDDTNGDSYINYDEAQNVVGQVLMPFDSDLNSQIAGEGVYPRGPAMTYNKHGSLSKINADLWKSKTLDSGQGIGFEGKVVMVHGTSFQQKFPPSLSAFNGEPAHLALPVVCGILGKMD